MDVNDTSIFTGGGDGGIRQWPLVTDSQNSKLILKFSIRIRFWENVWYFQRVITVRLYIR